MTQKDYLDLVDKALTVGSFVPLFRGDDGYRISANRFVPGDIPTDWSVLLKFGIYECYRKTKNPNIPRFSREAICELLEGDAFSIWCGYNVCFYLAYQECKNCAPFRLLDEELLQRLRSALHDNQEILKNAKIWQGKNLKEGLWADIISSAAIPKMRFGIELI